MRTSAIGFLFREMHKRGLRVRGGHMDMDIPEGANLVLWDGVRCWYDDQGRVREEPTGEKVPVAWWILEHKVGEEYDKVKKTVKGEKVWVDITIELYEPGYREQADTLVEVLEDPDTQYVFELGVTAELRNNNPGGFMEGLDRREWLECDKCGETDYNLKKYGPATANRQCRLTPQCTGKIRRLPPIFEITSPKTIPKRKPKAENVPEVEPLTETYASSSEVSGNALDSEPFSRLIIEGRTNGLSMTNPISIEQFLESSDVSVDTPLV